MVVVNLTVTPVSCTAYGNSSMTIKWKDGTDNEVNGEQTMDGGTITSKLNWTCDKDDTLTCYLDEHATKKSIKLWVLGKY